MQPNFLEHPRDLDAAVHRAIEDRCFAGAVDFPGQCFGFCTAASKGLYELAGHLLEGVNLIVEEDHLGRRLDRLVSIRRDTAFCLLVHYSSPGKCPLDAKETA